MHRNGVKFSYRIPSAMVVAEGFLAALFISSAIFAGVVIQPVAASTDAKFPGVIEIRWARRPDPSEEDDPVRHGVVRRRGHRARGERPPR